MTVRVVSSCGARRGLWKKTHANIEVLGEADVVISLKKLDAVLAYSGAIPHTPASKADRC